MDMENYRDKKYQKEMFDLVYSDLNFALYKIRNPVRSYYEKKLVSLALANVKDPSDLRCLDIGCGHGITAFYLSKYFKKVIGLDFSRKALETAKKLLHITETENVEIMVGDAESLSFDDKSFDVVFFKDLLHHTSNPVDVLSEMKRVSKQGRIIGVESNARSLQTRYIAKRNIHERGMLRQNVEQLKEMFNAAELSLVKFKEYGFYPYHLPIPLVNRVGILLQPIAKFEDLMLYTPLKKYANYIIIY